MSRSATGLLLALAALRAACADNPRAQAGAGLNPHAIVFYYNWYGSPEVDGKRLHWSHLVLKFKPRDPDLPAIPGGGDIAADYYPALGEYSSADPAVVEAHMRMIAQAGIGIVAVTWLGEHVPSARSLSLLFDAAARHGLRLCFQIEPAARPDVVAARAAIVRIVERFGRHQAFYRDPDSGRPLFFVYDSYQIPAADWARLLRPEGDISLRGGAFDAEVIGLWVEADEHAFFLDGGFDGFYTYFASRGFTYGATPEHWPALQRWAADNELRFVPSVALATSMPGCDRGTSPTPAPATAGATTTGCSPRPWRAVRPTSRSLRSTNGTKAPRSKRPCRTRSKGAAISTTHRCRRIIICSARATGCRSIRPVFGRRHRDDATSDRAYSGSPNLRIIGR